MNKNVCVCTVNIRSLMCERRVGAENVLAPKNRQERVGYKTHDHDQTRHKNRGLCVARLPPARIPLDKSLDTRLPSNALDLLSMSSAPPPTTEMTMPNVLAELGHKLNGVANTFAIEESISTLDHVRKASFTDSCADINTKPPVLLCDNLEPSSFFLYSKQTTSSLFGADEQFKQGCPNVFSVPNLEIMGGCMMHTERCCFPVVVLHSKTEDVLLVYCPRAPIDGLEAEMYDSAFVDSTMAWEDVVLGEEAPEVKEWRREAAVATRNIGYRDIPEFMCGDKDVNTMRYGVIPYLSLRAVKNEGECKRVYSAVSRMMSILPVGENRSLYERKSEPSLVLATMLLTGDFMCPKEIEERTPTREVIEGVCSRPVITTVAFAILRFGMDTAVDHNSKFISESRHDLPWDAKQRKTFDMEADKERTMYKKAKGVKVSEVWHSTNDDESYSLPALMPKMGRPYTTRHLIDGGAAVTAGGNAVLAVVEAIAIAAFHAKDRMALINSCTNLSNMTVFSAIVMMGKKVKEGQAILVASRDKDGRLGQVRLVGNNAEKQGITQVGKHNFARLVCLCPWITTFIVDRGNVVSMLCVNDPSYIKTRNLLALNRQKLELAESISAEGGARTTVIEGLASDLRNMKESMETMKSKLKRTSEEVELLKKGYDAQVVAINQRHDSLHKLTKEMSRKIDVLITAVIEKDNGISSDVPVGKTADALPKKDEGTMSPAIKEDADPTIASLKRSLIQINKLHKRMCH